MKLFSFLLVAVALSAQVKYEDIVRGPGTNWLTYAGDYKALGLKDKLPKMTESEALDLLASNGNLVKRPFVLSKNSGWVGFDPEHSKELDL